MQNNKKLLNPLVNVMKKASNTDSYLHILKYISLFGGVQVLMC